MPDHHIHLGWLVTHFLRSILETKQRQQLFDGLTAEVRTLQAEFDRTQRVIQGYGTLLDKCERHQLLQNRGNSIFLLSIIVVVAAWLYVRFWHSRSLKGLADTGGSSDSEVSPGHLAIPSTGTAEHRGLVRPSVLGKGKHRHER